MYELISLHTIELDTSLRMWKEIIAKFQAGTSAQELQELGKKSIVLLEKLLRQELAANWERAETFDVGIKTTSLEP